jgi:hypothetical protein
MNKKKLLPKIEKIADVESWFQYLIRDLNISIHPDNDFADYVNLETKEPTFSPEITEQLDTIMEGAFTVCNRENVDIYAVGIEIMQGHDLDIAMTAAIISDHIVIRLYEHMQHRDKGYIATIEQIGQWAIEFHDKYKYTNWETLLEDPVKAGFPAQVCCWDDAVMDYADKKLAAF